MNILTVNLLFSTLVFWIAARLYLLPRLQELKPRAVLLPILLLHSFRQFSRSKGRWISPQQSLWPGSLTLIYSWVRRTGYPHSGFRR